jgi:hypothetical protein
LTIYVNCFIAEEACPITGQAFLSGEFMQGTLDSAAIFVLQTQSSGRFWPDSPGLMLLRKPERSKIKKTTSQIYAQ